MTMHHDCARGLEVIEAIAARRWPARADASLAAHVAGCADCADLAMVAAALGDEQEMARHEAAALPSAEVVWFRSQARARADAARRAGRPVAIMQGLGLASAAAMISLVIGAAAMWVWANVDLLTLLPAANPDGLNAMGVAVRGTLLAIGLWLVLAPVAVYLAADD